MDQPVNQSIDQSTNYCTCLAVSADTLRSLASLIRLSLTFKLSAHFLMADAPLTTSNEATDESSTPEVYDAAE